MRLISKHKDRAIVPEYVAKAPVTRWIYLIRDKRDQNDIYRMICQREYHTAYFLGPSYHRIYSLTLDEYIAIRRKLRHIEPYETIKKPYLYRERYRRS